MLQYKDYLNRVIEFSCAEHEDSFNKIAELFPNVKEIDWDDYYPSEEDVICYIIKCLLDNSGSYAEIEDWSQHDKSVNLSYIESSQELEEIKKYLGENGWIIENYEDLKEEIEEEEERLKSEDYRNSLIQEIRNKASLDQLKEFCDSLT